MLVDNRAGSKELVVPLKKLGLPAELATLEFGDVAFEGRGEGGKVVSIGIEFKQISELVQSLRTNRLVGYQLPGMAAHFDFSWLLIEGIWRSDRSGGLVELRGKRWVPVRGRMSAMELEERLLTLILKGGIHVRFANTRPDSLRALGALYRWFTDRDWANHASHIALYQPTAMLEISDFRRTVSTFPGVGLRTSLAVELRFRGNLTRAILASEEEWANIVLIGDGGKTRKLGPKDAKRIKEYVS